MEFGKFIPCLFPFVFIPMWCAVVFLLAVIGGWSRLAPYYQARSPFEGKKWGFRSGRMGMTNYNGVLTIGVNDYGLYLAVFPLFRVGHPPLFIPWYDITTSKSKKFFVSYLDFTFARMPSVTFRVPERLGDTLLAYRTDLG
ncbi:MAG: hypothetical protein H6631_01365 [Anaerolineaceae bacterium]|nr:hypothetical protein [Anaerolineaceae bacterium]